MMQSIRLNTRTLSMALAVILSVLAVRAFAGEAVHGFVDGIVAGFTNGV